MPGWVLSEIFYVFLLINSNKVNKMKLDLSPVVHAVMAVIAQVIIGLITGQWVLGGLVGCVWFIAREHTQAEYRWIEAFGRGHRINMPWYGGFDYRAWDLASILDFAVPVVACTVVAVIMHLI